ncbi:hypothetical protein P3W45_000623 [Vairimorpha bombi]|jgi:hypothetical protein
MSVDQNEIIYELLLTGMYKKHKLDNLHVLNTILRQMHFEVVEWYDKSCYILKNTSDKDVIVGYNEKDNEEIMRIFENIIYDRDVQSNLVQSLIEKEWVEIDGNGKVVLSKKSLVLFKDMIVEMEGVYKVCGICSFLSYKRDIHEYCQDILDEKKQI